MSKDSIIITFAFALIFGGFAASEVFVELIQRARGNEDIGVIMMLLVYGCFCLGSTFAWKIVDRLGTKKSLFLSSLVYAVFVGSLNYFSPSFLLITSAMLGFAAAVLWNSYRTHMILSSAQNSVGKTLAAAEFTRLLAIILVSSLIGYLSRGGEFRTSQYISFLLTAIGAISLLALKDSHRVTTPSSTVDTFALFKSLTLLRLTSTPLLVSLIGGLMRGVLPILITKNYDIGTVGYINSILMTAQMGGNLISGFATDNFRKEKIVTVGTCLYLSGILALFVFKSTYSGLVIAIILTGFGRAISGVASDALVAQVARDKLSIAHSNITFMGSLGFLIPLILGLLLSSENSLLITAAVGAIIFVQLWILLRKTPDSIAKSINREFSNA